MTDETLRGQTVTLASLLAARETRAARQRALLAAYGGCLVSFTLNIAGPVKVYPLTEEAFAEGVYRLLRRCRAAGLPVLHREERHAPTGAELFLNLDAEALPAKAALCPLEEEAPLGRLFDIDVFTGEGERIAREQAGYPARQCLLCGERAAVCGRSRAHALPALQERTVALLRAFHRERQGRLAALAAHSALLREACTTPKPGLVDLNNSGAHCDMDAPLFFRSAAALRPFFGAFFARGAHGGAAGETVAALLPALREIGRQAEAAMLAATGGVNTHKGCLFSLGLLCGALGWLCGTQVPYSRPLLRQTVQRLAWDTQADFARGGEAASFGEWLYARHGIRGIRGEAAEGFPALFDTALPRLERLRAAGLRENEAGAWTLPAIIAVLDDTNLIKRGSLEGFRQLQGEMAALAAEPATIWRARLEALDREFIEKNLSPGGSADVLALAYFVRTWERLNAAGSPLGESEKAAARP